MKLKKTYLSMVELVKENKVSHKTIKKAIVKKSEQLVEKFEQVC